MCYSVRSGRRIYSQDDPIFGPSSSPLPSPDSLGALSRKNFFNLPSVSRTNLPRSISAAVLRRISRGQTMNGAKARFQIMNYILRPINPTRVPLSFQKKFFSSLQLNYERILVKCALLLALISTQEYLP